MYRRRIPALVLATLLLSQALSASAQDLTPGPVQLKSVNYTTHFIRHQEGRAKATDLTTSLDVADSTFTMVPGLADATGVSFQSTNYPGSYLRHRNGEVWLDARTTDALYNADATFRIVPGLSGGAGTISLESYNYPGSYLRHQNGLLYRAAPSTSDTTFNADATFIPIRPVANGAVGLDLAHILTEGTYLVSPAKHFFATMQADGNLCVYAGDPGHNGGGVWCSGTGGRPAGLFYAVMQADANLCVYTGRPNAYQNFVWCSGSTRGIGSYVANLADDSHLDVFPGSDVAHLSGGALWSAGGWNMSQVMTYLQSVGAVKLTGVQMGYLATGIGGIKCPGYQYVVPSGVSMVQVKATGGTGAADNYTQGDGTTGTSMYYGAPGGRGATVTAFVPVTAGQTLYVMPAFNGGPQFAYPGAGKGVNGGGGISFVSTVMPTGAPATCQVAQGDLAHLLVVAGGGGGAARKNTLLAEGGGGDAGLLGASAGGGQNGSGLDAGLGGGGATPSAGGAVGGHPGCGTEARYAGGWMQGSLNSGPGGPGGGGLYGGGAGGGGANCVANVYTSGSGGGGGGSSYVTSSAALATSSLDTTATPGVWIQPISF